MPECAEAKTAEDTSMKELPVNRRIDAQESAHIVTLEL